jgi:hypothetical protein
VNLLLSEVVTTEVVNARPHVGAGAQRGHDFVRALRGGFDEQVQRVGARFEERGCHVAARVHHDGLWKHRIKCRLVQGPFEYQARVAEFNLGQAVTLTACR